MQLFLQIRMGDRGYLLEARCITRVLPLMLIRSAPAAEKGVVGIINYQGLPVPVLDVTEMLLQRPSVQRVTTRLILLSVADVMADDASRTHRAVALLAEGASDVIRLAPNDFVASARTGGLPYLGATVNVDGSLLQKIELAELLRATCLAAPGLNSGNTA